MGFVKRPVIRYVIIGIFGALLETALFTVMLIYFENIVFSNIFAFHVAFVSCYLLNYRYTYQRPFIGFSNIIRGLFKYSAIMYVQLLVSTALLFIMIKHFGFSSLYAKVFQISIIAPISYMIQKAIVFKRQEEV